MSLFCGHIYRYIGLTRPIATDCHRQDDCITFSRRHNRVGYTVNSADPCEKDKLGLWFESEHVRTSISGRISARISRVITSERWAFSQCMLDRSSARRRSSCDPTYDCWATWDSTARWEHALIAPRRPRQLQRSRRRRIQCLTTTHISLSPRLWSTTASTSTLTTFCTKMRCYFESIPSLLTSEYYVYIILYAAEAHRVSCDELCCDKKPAGIEQI